MSLPSPLLLLFLAVSCAFSQELTFLRLPYVSLSSSSSSLPINQLDSLIANVLGVPSSLSWPGLTSSSGLQRAKANLLFVVDGLSTPAALHFPRGIPVDGDSNNNDDGVSVEARFRALTQRLQSAFQDSPSPLVLTNDAAPASNAGVADVNGALAQSQNVINRIAGAMKMSATLQPRHLNVTAAPDAAFFAELHDIQFLVDTLSSTAALQAMIHDATPDAFLFRFRTLPGLISAYGPDAPQTTEAKEIVKKIIDAWRQKVEQV